MPCLCQCLRPCYCLSHVCCRFDEFFEACKGCRFDFLATHLYTCNADALRWYLNDCKKYGLPVWLTEFACPNGAAGPLGRQQAFMSDALNILEMEDAVEKYAWFAPRTGGDWLGPSASLLEPDTPDLTHLGKLYTAHRGVVSLPDEDTRSWSVACKHCFELSDKLNHSMEQQCSDCGFTT